MWQGRGPMAFGPVRAECVRPQRGARTYVLPRPRQGETLGFLRVSRGCMSNVDLRVPPRRGPMEPGRSSECNSKVGVSLGNIFAGYRKGVVAGKNVSVRVVHGGTRQI